VLEKTKYYRVHLIDGMFWVRDNSSDRSTVFADAPIFLRKRDGWSWIEKNYPDKTLYDPNELVI